MARRYARAADPLAFILEGHDAVAHLPIKALQEVANSAAVKFGVATKISA